MHLFQPIYTSVFFVVKFHNLTPKKKINLKKKQKKCYFRDFLAT